MMVNIELPPDMEARVRRLAGESGLTPSDYVRKLVEEAMLKERGTHGAAQLAAWDEEDRTDDEAELKARSDQWEALKAAMNASHSSVPDVKIEPTARIESPRLVHRAQAADFIMEISKVEPDELPPDMAEAIAALHLLADDALRRAARTCLAPEKAANLEGLHIKRQTEGLSASEMEALTTLMKEYTRIMLVRSRAAALLKQRGHDISELRRGQEP